MKRTFLLSSIFSIMLFGCHDSGIVKDIGDFAGGEIKNGNVLEFSLDINRSIYEHTDYGEPPQLAVWLEQPDSNKIQTVWVSHRTGKNQWKGKAICAVSLPYWESRHKMEQSSFKERSLLKRLIDAISGATPKGGIFTVDTKVPAGSSWDYFIEVNLSGDYNIDFPFWLDDGTPDPEGNGQPSIIFKGAVRADSGFVDIPVLIGRSEQIFPIDSIITDVSGITSAKEIFSSVHVTCHP